MIATRRCSRVLCAAGIAVILAVFAIPDAAGQTLPTLPQQFLNTAYPSMTGTTINVPSGGSLQNAIDSAQLGDTIVLQAGATYTGTFTLRSKSGSGWIVIRTSTPDSSLPAQGRRVTPANASLLARIVTSSSTPAIQTAAGAHHYRLVGLEITVGTDGINYGIVQLGDTSGGQTSLSQVPSFIVLDRVYIHGRPAANVLRGVALNSASTAVIDSYISDVHFAGADSQAICGWNGPGPFKITNNYLEGAGENVMFGGADPDISNLVPSDIEVRGNHFFKPVSWRGSSWTVKNLFELKNARRVLVDGNIFEYNWLAAQNGFSILFTVRNQSGTAPWSVVEDVTFTHNIVRHLAAGVNILGRDDNFSSQQTKRILLKDNVFVDVSSSNWGGNGRFLQMLDGTADITVDHNTVFHTGEVIAAAGSAHARLTYRNNLTPHNQYGIAGDNYYGNPNGALATYFPGSVVRRNILQGGSASQYPADNFFPATMSAVGFMNQAGGDYRLQATSPYKNAGTDGKDVGADIDAVNAATAGVLNGTSGGPPPPPPPPDTTAPSVSITAPAGGASVSATVTITANASDNVGVSGVQFFIDGSALGAEDTASPYSASWNTTGTANGSHTVTAEARDAANNRTTSAAVTVTVNNVTDTTPPVVTITAPVNGAVVSGTTNVTANALDNVGVAGVQFLLDGSALGAEDTSAPYSVSWDTTRVANGSHMLSAVARDAAGNRTTSATVNPTVTNAAATQTPYTGTPFAVPGRFEAEDFDRGGEGLAYHDLTGLNQGGLYRTDDAVDIISPYAGGFVVNGFQTGEWLEYTINVPQAGTFRIEALVSSMFTGSRFHIEIDGADKTGAIDAPNTGAWGTFQWVGRDGITLAAGQHVLRISSDVEYFNLDAIRTSTITVVPPQQTPFTGSPIPVPGSFEAENFDLGGEGIAYHDVTSANQGGMYRTSEDVDIISPYAGGHVVNNFQTSEWLEYTINIAQAGTYRIEALVSSMFPSTRFHVEVGGTDSTGAIDIPSTGAWTTFQWVGKGGVSLPAGQHVLRLSSDVEYFNLDAIRVIIEADSTAPSVSITAPAGGATVSATVQVTANASDNVVVAGVGFYLDGSPLGAEDTTAPYAVSWNTTTTSNGSHTLTAVARDAAGNSTTSSAVQVMVSNSTPDTTAPTVSITAPAGGASVSATVQVSANASDNVGVAGVRFYRDGSPLGAEDTSAPYAVSWDTTTTSNGSHTLTAIARDAAGNITTSAAVTVTVANSTPDTAAPVVSITAPNGGATVSATVQVTADASDNVGVAGVQFYLDGSPLGAEDTSAPNAVSWNTTTTSNGSHVLTAIARDAAGNTTTSAAVTVTVANSTPDTTAPVVSITAPSGGATVTATVQVTANASDNVGVTSVRFYLDGSALGLEDTTAPYAVSWNTLTAGNGSHSLTAVARDAAGNSTTSSAVSVTVANSTPDTTPPAVSITAPSNGTTLSATVPVTASASDSVGVAGVRFYLDGSPLEAEDTTAPYSISWDTKTSPNGSHTLTAVARDAAANTTTSATVTVIVVNIGTQPGPYTGTPFPLPGRLEAEDFDHGGEGIAYHDVTPGNQSGFYRLNEAVDIINPYANGHAVNNFQTGEWLRYTVNVSQAGTYRIEALVSSMFTTSRFHIEVDGMNVTGVIDVPNTLSWWGFRWVGKSGISLSAGQHVLKIYADAEYFNLDAISATLEAAAAAPVAPARKRGARR